MFPLIIILIISLLTLIIGVAIYLELIASKNTTIHCEDSETIDLNLENKEELKNLDLASKSFELDLSNCKEIITINAPEKNISKILIADKNKIEKINLSNNILTNFNYSVLNIETLIKLDLSDNKELKDDILVFSHLINLTDLRLNNTKFFGSLQSLKNLTKLESLEIYNTEISADFEWLPNKVRLYFLDSAISSESQTEINVKFQEFKKRGRANRNSFYFSAEDWNNLKELEEITVYEEKSFNENEIDLENSVRNSVKRNPQALIEWDLQLTKSNPQIIIENNSIREDLCLVENFESHNHNLEVKLEEELNLKVEITT